MNRTLLMIVVMLVAAACGPTDSGTLPTLAPTVPPLDEAAPTQETLDDAEAPGQEDDLDLGESGDGLFTATLTGALDQTLAGSGSFNCEGGQHVLSVTAGVDVLTFTLPPQTPPSEYTLGDDEATITSYLEVGGTPYADDVFGVLTLDTVPTTAGEPVSGSFDMNYIAGGETVNAVGSFDLLADGVCG